MDGADPPASHAFPWGSVYSAVLGVFWWCLGVLTLGVLSAALVPLDARVGGLGLLVCAAAAWQWFRPRAASKPVELLRSLLLALPLVPFATAVASGLDAERFVDGAHLVSREVAVVSSIYAACVVLMLVDRLRARPAPTEDDLPSES